MQLLETVPPGAPTRSVTSSDTTTPTDATVSSVVRCFVRETSPLLEQLSSGLKGMALHRACAATTRAIDTLLRALSRIPPCPCPCPLADEAFAEHLDLLDGFVLRLQQLLEVDDERVRIKTAQSLRDLCREDLFLYANMSHTAIQDDAQEDDGEVLFPVLTFVCSAILTEIARNHARRETLRPTSLGDAAMITMDDTTGWRFLESYTVAYHALLVGVAQWDSPPRAEREFWRVCHLSLSLPETHAHTHNGAVMHVVASRCVVWESLRHTSRHMRERTHCFLNDLFRRATPAVLRSLASHSLSSPESDGLEDETFLSAALAGAVLGLEDDWSQVRNAATQALDALLSERESDDALTAQTQHLLAETYWAELLPRLCLNRFHAATSLQTLSLSLWQRVLGPDALGRRLLARHQASVLAYYAAQCANQNHMVAEAALQAIAEYVSKISRCVGFDDELVVNERDSDENNVTAPLNGAHTRLVFNAVIAALEDQRWPVKDSACVASGALWRHTVLSASSHILTDTDRERVEKVISALLEKCVSLWHVCLSDCIWSVRDNAAIAIADAFSCALPLVSQRVKEFALSQVRAHVLSAVPARESDEPQRGFSFLPREMVQAAEEKKARATLSPSDIEARAQAEALTLMPAVRSDTQQVQRKGWGCCIDCVDLRAAAPWEHSQSAVFLIRALALKVSSSAVSESNVLLSLCAEQEGIAVDENGPNISLIDAMLTLLQRTDYENFDKLHATLYEELPIILKSLRTASVRRMDIVSAQSERVVDALRNCILRDRSLEDPAAQGKKVLRQKSICDSRREVAQKCEMELDAVMAT